jgi:hypothetical protein
MVNRKAEIDKTVFAAAAPAAPEFGRPFKAGKAFRVFFMLIRVISWIVDFYAPTRTIHGNHTNQHETQ